MTKYKLIHLLRSFGDAIINTKTQSFCATIEFNNDYIKAKKRRYFSDFKENVLVFSWTDDKHLMIKPREVLSVEPLSKILNNTRDDRNG